MCALNFHSCCLIPSKEVLSVYSKACFSFLSSRWYTIKHSPLCSQFDETALLYTGIYLNWVNLSIFAYICEIFFPLYEICLFPFTSQVAGIFLIDLYMKAEYIWNTYYHYSFLPVCYLTSDLWLLETYS